VGSSAAKPAIGSWRSILSGDFGVWAWLGDLSRGQQPALRPCRLCPAPGFARQPACCTAVSHLRSGAVGSHRPTWDHLW